MDAVFARQFWFLIFHLLNSQILAFFYFSILYNWSTEKEGKDIAKWTTPNLRKIFASVSFCFNCTFFVMMLGSSFSFSNCWWKNCFSRPGFFNITLFKQWFGKMKKKTPFCTLYQPLNWQYCTITDTILTCTKPWINAPSQKELHIRETIYTRKQSNNLRNRELAAIHHLESV